ncbi:MAG: acylphosphatase, partial [Bacteroidales bacterium]|nr:acylphosphatase [Bacteroidales bacterium]
METVARHIDISGLVQGVGFRPFIYRHATRFGLNGWVRNHAGGVEVLVEGNLNRCNEFIQTLRQNAPRSASISALEISDAAVESCTVFEIKNSFNGTQNITNISPDLAVCPQCLADLKTQSRRLNYPFTNCVHCGPRFSVVKKIPYDRRHTTMEPFEMCPECSNEYRDKADRRFHAQTICCNLCGPRYIWFSGNSEETRFDRILPKVSQSV